MTDTVTRLMDLADQFAGAYRIYGSQAEPVLNARQALQDELQRLFTPLSDEQIATVYFGATGQSLRPQNSVLAHKFARAIEHQHGIGETK